MDREEVYINGNFKRGAESLRQEKLLRRCLTAGHFTGELD